MKKLYTVLPLANPVIGSALFICDDTNGKVGVSHLFVYNIQA